LDPLQSNQILLWHHCCYRIKVWLLKWNLAGILGVIGDYLRHSNYITVTI